jgi:hypothetical protein
LFALFLFFGLFPQQARAQWSDWENLGGQLLESPTCVSWGENRIDCFARHPVDTQVKHIAWDGTQWGIWESRGAGAAFPSAPNCLSWGANRIDCFARDYNQPGPMWHTFWDGTQWVGQSQSNGWDSLGGQIIDTPNCVSWGENRIDCFARHAVDTQVRHIAWDGTQWGSWEIRGAGAAFPDTPNCVSWGANRIDCFARDYHQPGPMWHTFWDGTQWVGQSQSNGWDSLNGQIIDTPNCVSWGANRLDCFARGGPDQAMQHWWNSTQPNGSWESLGAPPTSGGILDAPKCVSWGTNRIDCFVRGGDKAMWHIAWDGAQWGSWESLGAPPSRPNPGILNAPNCVSWGPNRLDCFVRGVDQAMWHKSWCASTCDSVLAVSTYHYDTLRTGWNSHERVLTVQNVKSPQFGLLHMVQLDDQVDAQPLFVAGQNIAGVKYDVIYVATAANTVYAIDASTGKPLLTRNLGAPVSQAMLPPLGGGPCNNNAPTVGITSTPVIDVVNKTLYVMAYTLDSSNNPIYQLHALDLDSLMDKVQPRTVAASHTREDGTTYNFMAGVSRQRAGLLLANGNIYAGFASFCDQRQDVSRGWLLGWQAATLQPLPANQLINQKQTAQSFYLSSIWMSGYGVAAADTGDLFFVTGNSAAGSYDPPVNNLQESVVAVQSDLSQVVDYFTPSDAFALTSTGLDQNDLDFGSGGVMLLPSQPGPNPRLAVAAGKVGQMFLLDRDNLGHFNGPNGPNKVLDMKYIGHCWCGESYFLGSDGVGRVVSSGGVGPLAGPVVNTVQVWKVQTSPNVTLVKESSAVLDGGAPPAQDAGFFTSVSSNGQVPGTAIIWAVSRPRDPNPAHVTLYAFDARNGATLFSGVAGSWPNTSANANIVPVVANGKVYVASNKSLAIFGLGTGQGTGIAFPAVAAAARPLAAATPSGTHVVYGTVAVVNGPRFILAKRAGTGVNVDATKAMQAHNAIPLVVGGPVVVQGSADASGTIQADTVMHAKPGSQLWPPDR